MPELEPDVTPAPPEDIERPRDHKITKAVADVVMERTGKDISTHIGQHWFVWGFSQWGGPDITVPGSEKEMNEINQIAWEREDNPGASV